MKQGAQNRRNAATKLNLDSSRSHSVFTIELVADQGGAEGSSKQVCTCMYALRSLVDPPVCASLRGVSTLLC